METVLLDLFSAVSRSSLHMLPWRVGVVLYILASASALYATVHPILRRQAVQSSDGGPPEREGLPR